MKARPELSFDGCGINGPDEYRTRLFTARREDRDSEAVRKYGPLCAAAPEMLEALKEALEYGTNTPKCVQDKCRAALANSQTTP